MPEVKEAWTVGMSEDQMHGERVISPLASGGPALDGNDGCRLVGWLWERSSATLGTPAAAALMRRAVSTAAERYPALLGIVVSRERLTYSYRLPDSLCSDDLEEPVPTYRALVRELLRLTGELTGGVMVRGLTRSEELAPWLSDIKEVDEWLSVEE